MFKFKSSSCTLYVRIVDEYRRRSPALSSVLMGLPYALACRYHLILWKRYVVRR